MAIGASITGIDKIIRNSKILNEKLEKKIIKKATGKAIVIGRTRAKQLVPKRTGLLKKAIKSAVSRKTNNARIFVDSKVFGLSALSTVNEVKEIKIKDGKKVKSSDIRLELISQFGDDAQFVKPSKYAHLVEFGTKKTEAKPFMRPALEQTKSQMMDAIGVEIKKGLNLS